MLRLSAIFVAVCMVLIAGSLGAVLYLWFAFSGTEAALGALALFAGLVLFNTLSMRQRDRGDVGSHIADLSRGTADLARQVADLGRRVSAMEALTNAAVDRTLAATRPITAEIGELGTLLTQLAETVAAHDMALKAPAVRVPEAAAPSGLADDAAAPVLRFKDASQEAGIAVVREAIEANRIDLYLQPIVTLPQRKVRFYEAMARLRTADGEVVLAADFLPFAETAGLMPKLDNIILFRCVQVVRRLLAKNRDIGLFCNISATTLGDPSFFPQLCEFLEANRALAPTLVLELRQAGYRALGPIEIEAMGALSDRGFRFSMDHVADLRLEPRDLADRGFRFIKVPVSLLLNRTDAASDIHPGDFPGLLSRFGIDMIAVKIESESAVVDLLDYDVKYGQGFLFSPPRPVRPEVMQGIADREDLVVRETAPAMRPVVAPPPEVRSGGLGGRGSALAQLARGVVARG